MDHRERARTGGPRTGLALVVAALCSTCAPPAQEGGVNVIGGASQRFGMLCRFRRGGEQAGNEHCELIGEMRAQVRATDHGARINALHFSGECWRAELAHFRSMPSRTEGIQQRIVELERRLEVIAAELDRLTTETNPDA